MTLTPEQREEIEKENARIKKKCDEWLRREPWIEYMPVTIFDANTAFKHRASLLADNKELREQLAALSAAKPQGRGSSSWNFDREADAVNEITPAQPSPDRLTDDERDRIDTARYHADKHQDEWWSEAIFNLANIIDRLTTPQAPSVPTREEIATLIDMDAFAPLDSTMDYPRWINERAFRQENAYRKADAILALFTPSPEQRGETTSTTQKEGQ